MTACFRVAQEALTNVLRHAAARHAWIELTQGDSALPPFRPRWRRSRPVGPGGTKESGKFIVEVVAHGHRVGLVDG
jgi:hypothetical protein